MRRILYKSKTKSSPIKAVTVIYADVMLKLRFGRGELAFLLPLHPWPTASSTSCVQACARGSLGVVFR